MRRTDIEDKVIKGVFGDRLGLTVSSVKRIHRLDQKANRDRRVTLELYNYNEKMAIFKNCKKLKGTNVTLSVDY